MTNCGPKGRPIPLHRHEREFEVFLCTRGRVQVWADDESRILSPGDMASVPAGTLHAYQFHSNFSEFIGPITPGGWDRFFDLCGTPYAGPAFPANDPSPPPFEKFGRAEGEFKMKYFPEAPYAEPTLDAPDSELPGDHVPYFLRAGEGPRHELGDFVATTMVGPAESRGELTMLSVEGSAGSGDPEHVHDSEHEALFVLDGRVSVSLDGEQHVLTPGDCASIPAGTPHTYAFEGRVNRVIAMNASGA
jgi:quercetin 2,3-dioxygenase